MDATLPFFDNMERLEYYAKWNKSGRESQISYDFTYMQDANHVAYEILIPQPGTEPGASESAES